jgi:hypothetical protein
MKDEIRTHLHDILHAGLAVKAFVAGRTFDDIYQMNFYAVP